MFLGYVCVGSGEGSGYLGEGYISDIRLESYEFIVQLNVVEVLDIINVIVVVVGRKMELEGIMFKIIWYFKGKEKFGRYSIQVYFFWEKFMDYFLVVILLFEFKYYVVIFFRRLF